MSKRIQEFLKSNEQEIIYDYNNNIILFEDTSTEMEVFSLPKPENFLQPVYVAGENF